ncbi:carbon-nitrogen hydrolase family protein [Pseudomonas sp. B21-051]|uniref:carbon-nitrogen hydrolase family protein n=1 Tax=Pseudomonas sp. B21-051 TaxID=2895491 RepID=UPI0021601F2E|nr:carbon-nitrogen hydrolase family protein [Pseudomonas sp. B21-051]UVK90810.1 carbon-nitrogen hydrolase family protein [Pseudomonas sp. B21-051]
MATFTIAAAQSFSVAGDLAANIARHLRFMAVAAEQGVELLVFPELSLTGYEGQMAADLAIDPQDAVLQPLRDCARELVLTAVVGMPIRHKDSSKVLIGALTLGRDGSLEVYSKQHLHSGEELFYAPGAGGSSLRIGGDTVALAVCADFSRASHAAAAAEFGADLYAAGVLIGEKGYGVDSAILQGYAQNHSMAVLMANHAGLTGGWQSAGRSAVWSESGSLVVAAQGSGEVLVIARRDAGEWQGRVIPVAAGQ